MNEETIIKSFGNPTTEGITVELFKPMKTKGSTGLASKTWFLSWQKIGELVFEQENTQPAEQPRETCKWVWSNKLQAYRAHEDELICDNKGTYCPTCGLKIEVVE